MAPHIVSRCAPASEPPTMARGSCHASARSDPVRVVLADGWAQTRCAGRPPRRCRATRRRMRHLVREPRRRRVRPSRPLFSGAKVSSKIRRSHCARCRRMPASSDCAPASRRRRASRDPRAPPSAARTGERTPRANPASRRGSRRARSSAGSAWCGAGSARPPWRPGPRPPCPAASWLHAPSGFIDDTPSTFQLTGRSASRDIVAMKSISSSVNPLRQPATMSSTVVPSWERTAAARRSISARLAARDGTGWPSPSLCVCTCEVEKPRAPSSSAACSAASMASMSASVAVPPTARSPMTSRRSVECPTRKPALTAMRPSRRPSQSPNEPQSHGRPSCNAASGMPSTRAIIRLM